MSAKDDLQGSFPPTVVELDVREAVRHCCPHATSIRVLARPSFRSLLAQVRDISVKGIGLRCDVPLPTGSQVALDWTFGGPHQQRTLLARVVHATWGADQGWLIGCEFQTLLHEDDVRDLLLRAKPA